MLNPFIFSYRKPTLKHYYVSAGGFCGIELAHSGDEAKQIARSNFGTMFGPISVRLANDEDLDWVAGMHGNIHKVKK